MVAGQKYSPDAPTTAAAADESLCIAVPQPSVKYTVSQSSLGWKGRAEEGEDPDTWYDAEGQRSGPPQNYWRQSMDERIHRRCMEAVGAIIDGGDDGDLSAEDALRALEVRMSIKKPMSNRKLLGRWAPIVIDGVVVAQGAMPASEEYCTTPGAGYVINAPILEIVRTDGRKTFEHRYGVLDSHMEEGESLTIYATAALCVSGSEGAAADAHPLARSKAVFQASAGNNERRFLPLEASAGTPGVASTPRGEAGEAGLYIGGVTFLNDYLLVAREADGALHELYLRLDGLQVDT